MFRKPLRSFGIGIVAAAGLMAMTGSALACCYDNCRCPRPQVHYYCYTCPDGTTYYGSYVTYD